MSKFTDFYNRLNGKSIDVDGVASYQCVDLAKAWNNELGYGVRHGNGKDWINLAGSEYTRINYTPGAVPQEGDIVSWAGASPANVPYGHVAIATGKGDRNSFQTFDQNWGGPICKLNNHSYQSVQGWIRPKNYQIGGDTMVTRQILEAITNAYLQRNPNEVEYARDVNRPIMDVLSLFANSDERKAYLNKYPEQITVLTGQIEDLTVSNTNLQTQIDVLNTRIEELKKQLESEHPTVPGPSQPLLDYSIGDLIRAIITKITKGGD